MNTNERPQVFAGRCKQCGLRFSIQDDLCEDCWPKAHQPAERPTPITDAFQNSLCRQWEKSGHKPNPACDFTNDQLEESLVHARALERQLAEAQEALNESNTPRKYVKHGGIIYCLYGTSSISAYEVLERKLAETVEMHTASANSAREFWEEVEKLREQRDRLAKALRMWKVEGSEGNGCFCDAQFAMHGAHPAHSDECKAATEALAAVKGTPNEY